MRIHHGLVIAALLLAACDPAEDGNIVVGELASDRIELTAEVNEPIVGILVAEGETVSAGQVLIQQDASRATARLAEANAVLNQAQARLNELVRGPRREQIAAARANVSGATDELDFRKSDFARVQKVHAQKLASPELLDRAKAALDAAEASLELRRAQLQELLSGTTVEELAQAEASVDQARARRDLVEVDLERHTIRAPVDGIVDSRLFEVGERPNPGQAMLIMLSGEHPYARVYIPERLRVHVRPGLAASIRIDGLEAPMTGQVRWVAAEAAFTPYFALTERDRGNLSFLAKIDFENSGERLPDGVPVEVVLSVDASE